MMSIKINVLPIILYSINGLTISCIVAVTQGTRFIMTLMIPLGLWGIFVGYAAII